MKWFIDVTHFLLNPAFSRLLRWLYPVLFLLALARSQPFPVEVLLAHFPFLVRVLPFYLLLPEIFHSTVLGIVSFHFLIIFFVFATPIHVVLIPTQGFFLLLIVAVLRWQYRCVCFLGFFCILFWYFLVQCFPILLYRKFCIIIYWNFNHSVVANLLRRITELF